MDDQSLIEQDFDSMDQIWIDDCAWLNDYSTVPKQNERNQDVFIGCVNNNSILISILIFIVGGITSFIIGSIMF
jgi:hypothetical protein